MTGTERIRWEPGVEAGMIAWFGLVGTCGPHVFRIIKPVMRGGRHTLRSDLPGQRFSNRDGDPGTLKAEAERRLEEFASSLGAAFRDEAWHDAWDADSRDGAGNLILRYKPTGGLYRILPVEDL